MFLAETRLLRSVFQVKVNDTLPHGRVSALKSKKAFLLKINKKAFDKKFLSL